MGLETVLDEIRANGAREQERIRAEARSEVEKVLAAAHQEAARITERRSQEAKARAAAMEREIVGASEFEARRALLSVERELMDDFKRRVLDGLANLSDEKNRVVLESLLGLARKEISKGVVQARERDLAVLAKQGYNKDKPLAGAGGFIVVSADGSYQLDYRYEVLLEDLWKEILLENAKLFGGA